MSNDGIALVHHIPRAFGEDETRQYTESLMRFADSGGLNKPGKGADHEGRDRAQDYVARKGEKTGIAKLVRGWHAIGHPVSLLIITIRFCLYAYKIYCKS
jgi:hypothetical protein